MATTVRDVVCGMDIEPESAAATSEYQGTTYYFCAKGCKVDFDGDQQKFLSPDYVPSMGDEPPAKRWWEFWKA